ncbi:thioredoxin-like [Ptychodera flava]|uniref:thioredoxin-like n=1 Tax=Ptychodera flava TaxID=63121 RepID=UPI00396A90C9
MSVKDIETKEYFESALKAAGDSLVVVDFTASWCGPCRYIGPIYEAMASEFTSVVFLRVDVNENLETAHHCRIQSMPTFQFYRNGEKVEEFSGANAALLRYYLLTLPKKA